MYSEIQWEIAGALSAAILIPFFWRKARADLASVSERSSATLQDRYSAYKALFGGLLFVFIDYSIRLYFFAKNLLYFPLGVDHRIFKRESVKVVFSGGEYLIEKSQNEFFVGLRALYVLICLATYVVSIWLFHSISNTFAPFVVDRNKLLLYCLITAFAVFLCDVSIIRTMISRKVRRRQESSGGYGLIFYRSLIVVATGLLLAFSLTIPLVENSLTQKLRDEARKDIVESSNVAHLNSERESLIQRVHALNAKRYCAGFALTGAKSQNEFYPAERSKDAVSEIPPLPILKPNLIRDNARVLPAISCAEYLDLKEPPCKTKILSPACPNAYRMSREIYVEAVGLFGSEDARRRYALSNAADIFRPPVVSTEDSVLGNFRQKVKKINDDLNESEKLTAVVPMDCSSTKTPTVLLQRIPEMAPASDFKISKLLLDVSSTLLVPKVFRCNANSTARNLDVNQVAGVVFDHYSEIFGASKGMVLVAAIALIIGLFELLVVVLKSSGTLDHLEYVLDKYDRDFRDNLKSGTWTGILKSEADMSTDITFAEHVGRIGEAARRVIASHMSSTMRCLLVNFPMFLIAWWILNHALDTFILPYVHVIAAGISP